MNNYRKILLSCCVLLILLSPAFAISESRLPAGKRVAPREYLLKAVSKYTNTIVSNPRNEDAYINRAYLNYLLGDIDLAIEDYNILISLNPNNEEFYLNRGYLNHISNRREAALNDYRSALKIKPNYAFAYNNIGVVLAEMGRSEESLNAYNTAIKINPNYADAYYNRGNLNTNNDNNEEALNDFNTAIKLNPTDSASYNNRGVVKRKLNCNVGALSDFSIAIKLDPEDIVAYTNRGHLKKRYFDSEGAEEDFNFAVKIAEISPTLIKDIEAQKAIESYQKPTVSSTTPIAYVDAPADLNKALRMPKVSQETLQKLADRRISTAVSGSTLKGSVETGAVRFDVSQPNLKQVPQTSKSAPEIATKPVANPELAECYYIRGLQKYILQNREGALADFNMAIKHNSEYADAYYYRAAIKRDIKDGSFVEDYKKAISINPDLKSMNDANVLNILK